MSSPKSVFVLLILVLALAAANIFLGRLRPEISALDRSTLVESVSDVRSIRLVRHDVLSTELKFAENRWRLVEPFAGSADTQAVLRFLDALSRASILDTVSDAELMRLNHTRAELALEDPVLHLELTDETGETTGLSFGARTPANDGVYVAVDNVNAVFVAPTGLLAAVDLPVDAFRRRAIFPSDMGVPSGFEIKCANGVVHRFVHRKDGWSFNGGRAARTVDGFVDDLLSASAVSFVWPVGGTNETEHISTSLLAGYGLDPDATMTVSLTDGSSDVLRRVSFGKEAADGLVYALVQNGGAVVTLPAALKDFAGQDPVYFADSRVFPLEPRAVNGFSIAADGALYSLVRDKDGLWRLESPILAPADQSVVETVLTRILSLSSSEILPAGELTVSVSTNGAKIAVARERVLDKEGFEAFRSREMLKIDPSLVKRIVSTTGGKEARSAAVVYDRDRRQWNVENAEAATFLADQKGVQAVLSALNPLRAAAVLKLNVQAADLDDYGLDAPVLTIAVDQNSSETIRRNILIGKRTRGGVFATIGSSDAVFVLSDDTVRQLSTSIVTP